MILIGIHDNEFDNYKPLIEENKLEKRIISLGMITGEETLNHYQIFDIDILASVMEGLSQSLLEAMYLGVPVVATRAAGNISLIKDYENAPKFQYTLSVKVNGSKIPYKCRNKETISLKENFQYDTNIENFDLKTILYSLYLNINNLK